MNTTLATEITRNGSPFYRCICPCGNAHDCFAQDPKTAIRAAGYAGYTFEGDVVLCEICSTEGK